MNPLANLQNILIAALIALVVGFGAGFYAKGKFVKAAQVDTVVKAQKQTTVGIRDSVKKSNEIDADVKKSNAQVKIITKTVIQRVKEKEDAAPATCPKFNFDFATASLLNSSRTGAAFDPTSISDEEGKAPTDLGIQGFVENDGTIIAQYRELAKDHDALVDYVESLLKKQAE